MNSSSTRKLLPLTFRLVREFSKSAKCNTVNEVPSKNFPRLKEAQKRFQIEDGLPVYLKGGIVDTLLYRLSWALVLIGTGMSAEVGYRLSFPKI